MRLVGWGALWGTGLFVLPFLAVAALGSLADPIGAGYVVFSLPIVVIVGAVSGTIGGALAAAIAPLARRGPTPGPALARCAVLYFGALAVVAVVALLALPPADAGAWAVVLPVPLLVATALATWGFATARRRARRAGDALMSTPAVR